MTSVSATVATRDNGPAALVEQYRDDYARVLPTHIRPDQWLRLATGALRKNPDLAAAAAKNPGSLLSALMTAARLGLEPGTEQFHLVPLGGEVVGIVGWQGEVDLMYRGGAIASVKAELVHQNDGFTYDPGTQDRPHHVVDWFDADRGPIVGVYAYAVMKDGATSKVVVMNMAFIERIKAVARGATRSDSPWVKWPEGMIRKTAIHQLANWVPTSPEYRAEVERAAAAVEQAPKALQAPPVTEWTDQGEVETLTGELVDEPPGVWHD